jgi:hypothetical protein
VTNEIQSRKKLFFHAQPEASNDDRWQRVNSEKTGKRLGLFLACCILAAARIDDIGSIIADSLVQIGRKKAFLGIAKRQWSFAYSVRIHHFGRLLIEY